MSRKKHIVYLGSSGFPYGMAEIQKIILISKSLVLKNNQVTVISTQGVHNRKDYPHFDPQSKYENIDYEYTSGDVFRHENFFKRNTLKIKGFLNEFRSIKNKKKNNKIDFAILSTHNFYLVLYYCLLSKIFGFKTVLNYVEFYSGVKKAPHDLRNRLNDYLFDKYAPKLVNSILPISEFLIDHIRKVAPQKEYLKIPGLTDFERYNNIEVEKNEKYILFCGATQYLEVIHFIIDSYNMVTDNSVYLYLVVNGSEEAKAQVIDYFRETKKGGLIKVFSKLSEKELFTLYKNAKALLIPLRPNFQDIARFPHKTGEYMASGNPVISTNYGEISYYFQDKENIFLAEEYDLKQYAEVIEYVIKNEIEAKQVGLRGKELARKLFDYRSKSSDIDNFLEKQLSENGFSGREAPSDGTTEPLNIIIK